MAGRVETLAIALPQAGPATGHRATVVRAPRQASAPVLADLGISAMPEVGEAPGDVPVVVVDRRDDGFEAGYAEGLEAARADAAAEVELRLAQLDSARAAVEQLAGGLAAAVERADRAAAELAARTGAATAATVLELVEAILGREVERAGGQDALDRALAVVPSGVPAVARLHPHDLESLRHVDHAGLRLEADPAMERGGCVVDLPDASVDARISSALDRVRAALLGEAEVSW